MAAYITPLITGEFYRIEIEERLRVKFKSDWGRQFSVRQILMPN